MADPSIYGTLEDLLLLRSDAECVEYSQEAPCNYNCCIAGWRLIRENCLRAFLPGGNV